MKRLVYLLLFLVLIAGAFFVIDSYVVPLTEKRQQQNGTPTISSQVIEEETEVTSIQVEYPITHNSTVNRILEAFAREQIETFKEWAEDVEPLLEGRAYGLWLQFQTVEGPQNFVSFVFTLSLDTGGAHPNHVIVTKVFDFDTGAELGVSEVFAEEKLEPLSEFAASELITLLGATDSNSQEWIREGSGAESINFEAFSLNKDGVAIYYSPYQVAPYALGAQVVLIPYSLARTAFTESFANTYSL